MKKITLLFIFLITATLSFGQTFNGATGPIPDNICDATNEFAATVSGIGTLDTSTIGVSQISFDITHTWDSDIDMTLIAPDGTTSLVIVQDAGSSGDDFTGTVVSDDGADFSSGSAPFTGDFAAQGGSLLATFNGVAADGDWILQVCDDASGDTGTLNSWSITFATPPSCPTPTVLTAENITDTTVDIGWTDTNTSWEYVVQPAGTGEPTSAGTSTMDNPTNVTGLMDSTDYEFYVRADCGGDLSPWAGPVQFSTIIPPPVNDLPAGAIAITPSPQGTGCGTATFTLPFSTDGTTDSGIQGGCSDSGLDQFFTWTATTDGLIFNSSSPGDPGIVVWDATGTTEIICSNTFATNFELSGWNIGDNLLIQIYDFAGSTSDVAFCLEEFTLPTCPDPSALNASSVTNTTVDLGWTENGTATTWEYVVQAPGTGEPAGAGTSTMDNPVNVTGLTADTAYEFYVRADCGGEFSAWVGPGTFSTTPLPPACGGNFVDSGGSASDYSSNENITYTICPDNAGDAVTIDFSFFSTENNGTGCFDGLTIYNGSDTSAPTIDPPAGGTIWCWDRDDATPTGSGDLQGMMITSSDASGCLTFVFTSDGSITREGWEATVTCNPLSIDENTLTDFKYYPNPVNNTLTLQAQNAINNVIVYNMLGQEVMRTSPNALNEELDMSSLNSATYFVKVTVGETTKTIRIMKQ